MNTQVIGPDVVPCVSIQELWRALPEHVQRCRLARYRSVKRDASGWPAWLAGGRDLKGKAREAWGGGWLQRPRCPSAIALHLHQLSFQEESFPWNMDIRSHSRPGRRTSTKALTLLSTDNFQSLNSWTDQDENSQGNKHTSPEPVLRKLKESQRLAFTKLLSF